MDLHRLGTRHPRTPDNHPSNHYCPLGDPEPDWSTIQPYNRLARCLPRTSPQDPWQANTIVGQTLYSGGFTDVASHLADQRNDPTLRRPTGKHGGIRNDQIHVTRYLFDRPQPGTAGP